MKTYQDAVLRVLSVNNHIGQVIRSGGLVWAVRRRRADLIAVQEGRGIGMVRSALAAFARWPRSQPGKTVRRRAMTYVLWRRRRFTALERYNRDTTHGSRYPRRCTGVVLRDKRTGRIIVFSTLHPDPLGAGFLKADARARAKHILQVKAHRAWHRRMEAKYGDVIHICAGDANERLSMRAHRALPGRLQEVSARGLLGDVGMRPMHDVVGGDVDLDDIFFAGPLRAGERDVFWIPTGGADHASVWGRFAVGAA